MPRHVGVVMDGNRRWARAAGLANPSQGHRHGADHIAELLDWCTDRDLDLLPRASAEALRDAIRATAGRPAHLTLAIGYDGHSDILDGIRAALRSGDLTASEASIDAITAHLAGGPTKEIDLVIRTSGESRLSGFFPWQTAHAEIYLSPKMWPDFAEADFDAALRRYATARERLAGR